MTADAAGVGRDVEVYVAPGGNAFMRDIAEWIREASEQTGRASTVIDDGSLPGDHGAVAVALVVAPHELFELSTRSRSDRRSAAARSIPIATEQPGTPWFERSLDWCRHAPWAIDINHDAVAAARAAGVDCRELRLGAVPSMDLRPEGRRSASTERPVDVAVLAGLTPTRERALARLAPTLWPRRCELRLVRPDRPVTAERSAGDGTVFGREKYELLARTKIVLNLHRDDTTAYFEWARAVEAMANGCVVVTEPSTSMGPLVDGEHLVVTDDPARDLDALLDDPERLDRIALAASDLVHGDLALHRSLAPLLDLADETLVDPGADGTAGSGRRRWSVPTGRTGRGRRTDDGRARGGPSRRSASAGGGRAPRPAFRPHRAVRRRLFDAVVAERRHRREIDAARSILRHGSSDHVEIVDTGAWGATLADVGVVVTLFDYEDLVVETLDSVAASSGVDIEIVVVDDHSTDGGRAVVESWMRAHDHVAVRFVARSANGGLAAARRLGVENVRADRVMILDADNLLYPTCLGRLSAALDDHLEATFAWSILEVFGERTGLLSAHAWDPDRLVEANQIDAQAMFRRSALRRLGGHRELEGMLAGWEDWDLWLRMVSAGEYGVLVPEILGRYRAGAASMVSAPNRFTDVMLERFEALHPTIDFPQR